MKDVIVLSLIAIAAFWGSLVGPETVTVNKEEIQAVLKIEEPQKTILSRVDDVESFNIENEDALKLAMFNFSFSKNVVDYSANSQELNDVYVQAAKNMFKDSLSGKYDGYSTFVTSLLEENITSKKVHELSEEEKKNLSDTFEGLAWVLLWTE